MAKRKGIQLGKRHQTATITFEDGDLEGVEVDVRIPVPLSVMFDLAGDRSEAAFATFAGEITGWNLEDDDGKPVPVTLEAIGRYFRGKTGDQLLTAWMRAVAQPAPLSPTPSS